MYFYLYDAFLREKKYEVPLARIEGRLFDLGVQGKSEKLTILKSMKELVDGAVKRGADTIVAVGNDETLSKMIRMVADRNVILGYIPMGGRSAIASMLGIPSAEKACDVLSARIIERFDLGKANDAYFLSFLQITPSADLLLECDERYSVEPIGLQGVTVYNFGFLGKNPRDGILEAVVQPETGERTSFLSRHRQAENSIFSVRSVRVKNLGKSLAAYADGQTVVKTPILVTAVPKKIRMIVGKNRQVPGE
ncbi:MAG: diacylglycerol kinase family protein [bacterium]